MRTPYTANPVIPGISFAMVALWCNLAACLAHAQSAADSSASTSSSGAAGGTIGGTAVTQTAVDFSVPESAALAVLGSSTTKVVRPATPEELVTHLLQGSNAQGILQTGLALDFVPYLLFHGQDATLENYNRNAGLNLTRVLSNIQLALGTAKNASQGSNAVSLAGGLRYVIFDLGDPRRSNDLFDCFAKLGKPETSKAKTGKDLEDAYKNFPNDSTKGYQSCLDSEKQRSWNRSAMEVGFAPSWTSPDGSFSSLKSGTQAYYWSAAYGFEHIGWAQDNVQLIGHLQSAIKEVVTPTASASSPTTMAPKAYTQNSTTYGLKLRFALWRGTNLPKSYLSFEADEISERPDTMPHDHYRQASVTFERQVASKLSLTLQLGGSSKHPSTSGSGSSFAVGGLKWSLGQAQSGSSS